MNLYEQISNWIIEYQPLNNWIYFNATPVNPGAVSMNSVAGDRVVRKFIDGSKQKEIIFAIVMISQYDPTGTSSVNLDAMNEVNNFSEWIDEQMVNKNFPEFKETDFIEKIEVLSNVPSMLVDTQQGLAKYQFQVKITYKDESEVIK